MARVLIIDDEPAICRALDALLSGEGHEVVSAASAEEGLEVIVGREPDVVILDVRLPGMNGLEMLGRLGEKNPGLPVIVITAHGDMSTGIEAVRRGAFEYLVKPMDNDAVVEAVSRASNMRRAGGGKMKAPAVGEEILVGRCPAMQDVYRMIGSVADTDASVLITGESGSGKELVARAIHAHCSRKDGPFVAVNCAGLPETLLESELYGHVKGAFTGAFKDRMGRAEAAAGGTLFLDEIAEIPLRLQAKLLRFVERREIERVGDTRTINVDARILAATNRDLERCIREGNFREDLYYRLNVVSIRVPPLRERSDDIPLLAAHFLDHAAAGKTPIPELDARAAEILIEYDWPGNVRELKNAVEHAVILTRGGAIRPDVLPSRIVEAVKGRKDAHGENALDFLVAEMTRRFAEAAGKDAPTAVYDRVVAAVEKPLLREIMELTGGNQVQAARILGIHRTTLKKKLQIHGLI